jgi:hypothetical protein
MDCIKRGDPVLVTLASTSIRFDSIESIEPMDSIKRGDPVLVTLASTAIRFDSIESIKPMDSREERSGACYLGFHTWKLWDSIDGIDGIDRTNGFNKRGDLVLVTLASTHGSSGIRSNRMNSIEPMHSREGIWCLLPWFPHMEALGFDRFGSNLRSIRIESSNGFNQERRDLCGA